MKSEIYGRVGERYYPADSDLGKRQASLTISKPQRPTGTAVPSSGRFSYATGRPVGCLSAGLTDRLMNEWLHLITLAQT